MDWEYVFIMKMKNDIGKINNSENGANDMRHFLLSSRFKISS
jgi:hypothetical protein